MVLLNVRPDVFIGLGFSGDAGFSELFFDEVTTLEVLFNRSLDLNRPV